MAIKYEVYPTRLGTKCRIRSTPGDTMSYDVEIMENMGWLNYTTVSTLDEAIRARELYLQDLFNDIRNKYANKCANQTFDSK